MSYSIVTANNARWPLSRTPQKPYSLYISYIICIYVMLEGLRFCRETKLVPFAELFKRKLVWILGKE